MYVFTFTFLNDKIYSYTKKTFGTVFFREPKNFTHIPGLRQSIKMKCDYWLPFKDLQCSLSHFLEFINNFDKKWTVGIIYQNVTCQAFSEPENTNLFCKSNHHLHEKWIYVASFCSDAKSSPYIFYLANFFHLPQFIKET